MILSTRRHNLALIALCLVSIGTLIVYHGDRIDLRHTYSAIYSLKSGFDDYQWLEPAGNSTLGYHHASTVAKLKNKIDTTTHNEGDWFEPAANSTLGFGSIEYLNIRNAFDRTATLIIQAEVADLKINRNDAVSADDINEDGKGTPPSNRAEKVAPLRAGVKACTFSHMELWEKLISSDQQTMFVLESDAMWSVNVRENNKLIAKGLHQLQEKMANATLPHPSPNDPFNSKNWDILNFGACADRSPHKENYVVISDPEAMDTQYFDLEKLHEQRVIRQTGSMSCTTAYAVSRKGAMKMLLRAAINFDKEVDIMINEMMTHNKLVAYGPHPVPIIQWKYKSGIGADDLNSDIEDRKSEKAENAKELWDKIMKEESVWESEERYPDIKNDALSAAGSYINSM